MIRTTQEADGSWTVMAYGERIPAGLRPEKRVAANGKLRTWGPKAARKYVYSFPSRVAAERVVQDYIAAAKGVQAAAQAAAKLTADDEARRWQAVSSVISAIAAEMWCADVHPQTRDRLWLEGWK